MIINSIIKTKTCGVSDDDDDDDDENESMHGRAYYNYNIHRNTKTKKKKNMRIYMVTKEKECVTCEPVMMRMKACMFASKITI